MICASTRNIETYFAPTPRVFTIERSREIPMILFHIQRNGLFVRHKLVCRYECVA